MSSDKKIAVLGAGVMGTLSAYLLSRALPETKITLFDPKGFPANNASYIAGGMLAPLSELDHMPQSYLAPAQESVAFWQELAEHDFKDHDFDFAARGSLLIAHPEDRHMVERFKSILPANDDWAQIASDEIATLEPALNTQKFNHAIFMKTEGHLHPKEILALLHDKIVHKEQHAATPEELASLYDLVIDCRGMAAKADTAEKLRGVKGETLLVHNPHFSLNRPLRMMHPRYPLYIVPRKDNIFMIGATIIESEDEEPRANLRSAMELMSALYSLHPSFGDAKILEINAGVRPSFNDNLPRISQTGNIISANGLYRHGFLLSPALAKSVVSLVTQQEYAHNALFIK